MYAINLVAVVCQTCGGQRHTYVQEPPVGVDTTWTTRLRICPTCRGYGFQLVAVPPVAPPPFDALARYVRECYGQPGADE